MKKREWFLVIFLLFSFTLTRLPGITSGLNLLEPDEWDYQNISQSFASGWLPTWKGEAYLEKFPLFVFLGFVIEKFFHFTEWSGPYVNLRLISVISNGLTVLLMFLFLSKKMNSFLALKTSLLFILTPVILFYSRVGTLESFASLLAMVGFLVLIRVKKFNFWQLGKSALIIGIAILAKQVNLILLMGLMGVLVYGLLMRKEFWWRNLLIIFLTILFLILVFLSLGWLQQQVTPKQWLSLGEKFLVTSPIQAFNQLRVYIQKSGYWLSWPVIFWLLIGSVIAVYKRWQERIIWLLSGLLMGWLGILGFYGRITPRNLLIGVPFLFLLASLGYQVLMERKNKVVWGLSLFSLVSILPFAWQSWQSGFHRSVEKAADQIATLSLSNPGLALYAGFDQEKLSGITGKKINFLTPEATLSGIILIDQRKTKLMTNLTEPEFQQAAATLVWIEKEADPIWNLSDNLPHFPGTNQGNEFAIYVFKTKNKVSK